MKVLTGIIAGLLLVSTAWADNNQRPSERDGSLEQLIKSCRHLEANSQIKTFSTEVVCSGHKTYWQQVGVEGFGLPNSMVIRADLYMKGDRYKVNGYVNSIDEASSAAECNVYEEFRSEIPALSVRLSSCADLEALAHQGRDQFCVAELERLGVKLLDATSTGRLYNSCTGKSDAGNKQTGNRQRGENIQR